MQTRSPDFRFAETIHALADRIGPDERRAALPHVVDTVTATVAGYDDPAIERLVASGIVTWDDALPCGLIGRPGRSTPAGATLVNAMAGHIHDYDDDEAIISLAHVSVPVLAAAWALAEDKAASGRDLLDAYVIGVETMVALGRIMNPTHYVRGWHSSATLGIFGAAAAAGRILNLSLPELMTAFSLAATQASGIRSAFGSDAKPYQLAAGARRGVEAALLARAGITSTGSLFGAMGFATLYAGDAARVEAAIARIGAPSAFVEPAITIKAYPCCTATHPAIEAALRLRAQDGIDWHAITSITVSVGETVPGILIHDDPATAQQGKFSAPYCVAAAFRYGTVGLAQFDDALLADAGMQALISKTRVIARKGDPDLFLTELRVTTTDGRETALTVEHALGSPARPMTREEITAKLLATCPQADEAGAAFLWSLADVPSWPDFTPLLRNALTGAA